MTEQSRAWKDFLDCEPVSVEAFARSAIPELPRVTTPVAKLNPEIWPDLEEQLRAIEERDYDK